LFYISDLKNDMKQLDVTLSHNRDFVVWHKGQELGRQHFPKWNSQRAEIYLGKNVYLLEPKGFWQATQDVSIHGKVVLQISTKWNGFARIERPEEPNRYFIIKPKGFFKQGYMLTNHNSQVLMEINSRFRFKNFKTMYTINCNSNFGATSFEELLIMVAMHCYRMAQRAAAAASASQ